MLVRLYATTYPAEVVGMVLVDSSHEDQLARFEAIDPEVAKGLRAPASDESVDLDALSAALHRNPWRSTLPLVVLTHGKVPPAPAGREAQSIAIEKAWLDMQRELATRSPEGQHIVAAQSGHYIQMEQPALLIEAVRQIIHPI
jgi:pimeloyl-ACP methyl ester carboxylesterase